VSEIDDGFLEVHERAEAVNRHNILAAIDWLVSEPGTCNFLHYSGHGGQVQDPTGARPTGVLDTIVPYDFETRGQIDSDILHRHLVSNLPPNSTLYVRPIACSVVTI